MRASVSLVLLLLTPLASAAHASPADSDIVVRADVARSEIERILNADNLDTEQLSPQDVADLLASIPRGRAPDDFWQAYQIHVDAWVHLAELTDGEMDEGDDVPPEALDNAEGAINLTFDLVESIARSYGAKIPIPIGEVRRMA
ncbi:hypothetical protein LZ518_01230 [Sphingomonas sp. RB56-2]|uniref:DUF2059 domain-containing protein n=1 Tax=Sphingomonas brevis TaxID=2908206 RepID=A0ABT0S5U7_9SPHN|nr:hypothetical protein [Sphingomonas brevis]MCL6739763.1 hypothetical protein [Sphingomonas brevis]